jgi:hypothetical protein
MQRDLFTHSGFSITAKPGLSEPYLWVRRLVIWGEPGTIVREINLRPGLNIIWSPDPGTSETAPIGHGSGKTTFCRLLRYCLGEDSFAPQGQRLLIWKMFPKGYVGAEVMLAGRLWIVVRALGDHKHDVVMLEGSFADAFREGVSPTGIEPLRAAITSTIIGDAAKLMPAPIGESGAWEASLAWATRDQECRFGKHIEWRDPDTDSRSPVRGRSEDDRLTIIRAFIGALLPEEVAARRTEQDDAKAATTAREQSTQIDWSIRRSRNTLVGKLGGGAEPGVASGLDGNAFKVAASAELAKLLELPAEASTTNLERARSERKVAANELAGLTAELREVEVRTEVTNKTLAMLRAELPEAHARLAKEQNPVCPICEVPISKVLADGCSISTETCDLSALQVRIEKNRETVRLQEAEIQQLQNTKPRLLADAATANQRLESFERTVVALERAFDDRSSGIRAAQRLLREAEDYDTLVIDRSKLTLSLEEIESRLTRTRETLAAHRAAVADTIAHLSARFDSVLREFVPGDINGEVKLDGHGLALKVQLAGERSTAAIESLKVVAFDLAVLAMTIEGRTRLSGFLVHDSPREADLGASIYHRLFGFVARLEAFGPSPLFQYIVTTTTEPPEDFRAAPWLALTIKGAPAQERLLKADL